MRQIISVLTLSAFVGMSALSAQTPLTAPAPSVQESALTKDDAIFLFGKNAENLNVQVLSQKELEETKGELWPAIFWGAGTGFAWGAGQSVVLDYWNNRPINWGNALNNGISDAAAGIVFGGLGSKLGIR